MCASCLSDVPRGTIQSAQPYHDWRVSTRAPSASALATWPPQSWQLRATFLTLRIIVTMQRERRGSADMLPSAHMRRGSTEEEDSGTEEDVEMPAQVSSSAPTRGRRRSAEDVGAAGFRIVAARLEPPAGRATSAHVPVLQPQAPGQAGRPALRLQLDDGAPAPRQQCRALLARRSAACSCGVWRT